LDLAERAGILDVVRRRAGEIRVVPDVEEIRREAKVLPFRQSEVLDEREVPVLLERAAVDVAAESSEAGCASIGVKLAAIRIGRRSSRKIAESEITSVSCGYLRNVCLPQLSRQAPSLRQHCK
jgi:hypothetical protein